VDNRNNLDFFVRVWEVTRSIPYGRVTSYGAIAKCLGTKYSSRMVGWALNKTHGVYPQVPAHRVVNRNGALTGKYHFETPSAMEEALKNEGVMTENNQVVDFDKLFWDPQKLADDLMNNIID
jgi:methylated-DNA-protein-cysteine methyltransferase-like protein